MKLSLRDFADIVRGLKESAAESQGRNEKRRASRVVLGARVQLYVIDGAKLGRGFSALTRDVSLTGMGLLQSIALPAKQEIAISLPRSATPLYLAAVVRHCRMLADGLLATGVEFTGLLDPALEARWQQLHSGEHARIRQAILG